MVCVLPDAGTFHDASAFRQVPDHQEVYMHDSSGASVIIELLAHQRDVPDADAAQFHFAELAKANRAEPPAAEGESGLTHCPLEPRTLTSPHGPFTAARDMAFGVQRVAKFNEHDRPNDVLVAVAVLRLPKPYWTDVLCSVSAPIRIAEGSSEQRYVTGTLSESAAVSMLTDVFESIEIRDYGLFVEEE